MPIRPSRRHATPAPDAASGSDAAEAAEGVIQKPDRRARARRRRTVILVALGVLLVVVAAGAWVGIRGLLAKHELEQSIPLASQIQRQLTAGDTSQVASDAAALRAHTHDAAALTGDPVWRAAEVLPWLGGNLSAVRQSAEIADTVADKAVMPLARAVGRLSLDSLKPKDGRVDVTPLKSIAPVLLGAQHVLERQASRANAIETDGTIGPVASAVSKLTSGLDEARTAVTALANTSAVLPGMLGADGPRNILLLIQNPAELRATGGVPGAMAVVHTDDGRISLTAQVSDLDFRRFAEPVLPLPAGTEGLYGTRPGRYIQNISMTPYFPLTGELAATMWQKRFGTHIDAVVKADPVALAYLLKATGPVTLATGDTLGPDNTVPMLLSEVYQRYTDQRTQDAFFASAASSVFEKLMHGSGDAVGMIKALARAGAERRILIYSSVPAEQKVLEGTTLAGELPASTTKTAGFGVYFNDSTGSKMDYYLKARVTVASRVCRADGHPETRVDVTMTNTAPADAGTSLPLFVAGPVPGTVTPGHVRNQVTVYAPKGSIILSTTSDSAAYPSNAAHDFGHTVGQFEVELKPGETRTVSVELVQMSGFATRADVVTTPGLNVTTGAGVAPRCGAGVN
ncbi:DUF4012 domain-containing protein [Microbacterium sp. STN6]|uniref:DUF4012 domain-containing protein n=1 Tax=Microbacterium sp. STN6 TaxID=2995588 RepID=UPI002260A434|nr:DUF4012 domain-containing protein [Microbacterium sp. STN6]MCX7520915.1 DUF4012 domain-containing protein [Microbacterium sp. STN6]